MPKDPVFSRRRTFFIFVVALALAAVLGVQIIKPVREQVAKRYLQRGDTYLVAQDFVTAKEQYRLALSYNPSNQLAKQHLLLAEKAPTDIAVARSFYEEHAVSSVIQKLDTAQKKYATPKDALQVGADFYQAHDYVYAQYPLLQAVELDPNYPEAWHYLALTYQELAKIDSSFNTKAQAALQKQNDLSPKYLTPSP